MFAINFCVPQCVEEIKSSLTCGCLLPLCAQCCGNFYIFFNISIQV